MYADESTRATAVYTASSGAQALQSAPELHPDIMLLDLMMPEMDGFELAGRIRSESWGKDLSCRPLAPQPHLAGARRLLTSPSGYCLCLPGR